MSAPQNTIAIVYDYDQTLSPSYMQDEVVFPAFGINSEIFWRRCSDLVRDHGYDNELAYMKVLLDQLGMDRPTNEELKKLGAKLNFYKGLPEMFEEFRGGQGLLTTEHTAHEDGPSVRRVEERADPEPTHPVKDDEPARDEREHRAPTEPPERAVQETTRDHAGADRSFRGGKEGSLHEVEVVQHADPRDAGKEMEPPQQE